MNTSDPSAAPTAAHPQCIASSPLDQPQQTYAKAQWSPDGTCLLLHGVRSYHSFDTVIAPVDLLTSPPPHTLTPYTTLTTKQHIYDFTAHPQFDLSNPNSCLALLSIRDLPIRMINVLSPSYSVATYKLIDPNTEKYITPTSLIVPPSGTHLLAGSDSLISSFDLSRPGDHGPTSSLPTIPSKRTRRKGNGIGMKGFVSSLSLCTADSILAAGTLTRSIGMYDASYPSTISEMVSVFSVKDMADKVAKIGGNGISTIKWSPCSRYLLVAERRSHGILVFDVRVQGQLLGWLDGRDVDESNLRLEFDVVETADGACEVWAGGTGGTVSVWQGVGATQGRIQPSFSWKAHEDRPVTNTMVHSSGRVVATIGGRTTEEWLTRARGTNIDTQSSSSDSSSDSSSGKDSGVDNDDDQRQVSPTSKPIEIPIRTNDPHTHEAASPPPVTSIETEDEEKKGETSIPQPSITSTIKIWSL